MSEISTKIRKLMDELNLSYGELHKMTGIPKSALQRYVTGETENIPVGRLEKIAKALNTTASCLLGRAGTNEILLTDKQIEFLGMCAAREIKAFFKDPENVQKYEQSRKSNDT